MSTDLTRGDFEALLWDHLLGHLRRTSPAELLGDHVTAEQWAALSVGEQVELQVAIGVVKARLSQHVWKRTDS